VAVESFAPGNNVLPGFALYGRRLDYYQTITLCLSQKLFEIYLVISEYISI
jgi:hypothetical protein